MFLLFPLDGVFEDQLLFGFVDLGQPGLFVELDPLVPASGERSVLILDR